MYETFFPLFVMLWFAVASIVVVKTWQKKTDSVGIVIIYIISFGLTHWVNAVVTLFPWFNPIYDSRLIKLGFAQAVIGIIAFAIGNLLIAPLLWQQHMASRVAKQSKSIVNPIKSHKKLGLIYLGIGMVSYFVIAPYTAHIQTVYAFVYSMTQFMPAGIIILLYQAIQNKQKTIIIALTIFILAWPLYILMTQGFLSFGASFVLFVFVISIRINRMPPIYFVPLLGIVYLGASFMVSYFDVRSEIRERVWYQGNLTTTEQLGVNGLVFENFRLLNITDEGQLTIFDQRFPYNYFMGQAIENINSGLVEYSGGQTITDAFLMLIPRIIWPEKPYRTGGDALIAKYTGIDFYGGTTSQPTPVLEFYINFGTFGVIVGSIIVGVVVAIIDRSAAHNLENNNFMVFSFWIIPAYNLLQAENGLIMVIASSVVSFILVPMINIVVYNYLVLDERYRLSAKKASAITS